MQRVELLLILNQNEMYLGNFEKVIKTFELTNKAKCKEGEKIEYDGLEISYQIERIYNKSLIYDIKFQIACEEIQEIKKFETFVELYKNFIKQWNIIKGVEEIWNDIGAYYAKLAYPEINLIENKMRYLISKFMYFQEEYDWSTTHVSDKLKVSRHESNINLSIPFAVDFNGLTDILFNEYPIKKIDKLKKQIENNNTIINKEDIEDYLPLSNWDRYIEKHVNIKTLDLKKLWKEIYTFRCAVAHNRSLKSEEYVILQSKINKAGEMIDKAIKEIPQITLSQKQLQLVEAKSSLRIASEAEYFSCLDRCNPSDKDSITEYYPEFYLNMSRAKEIFEKDGYLVSDIFIARNVLSSIAFDVFKKNDSCTYYHIGCFQGDYLESENKEYYSFWRIEGKIMSPKDDSDYKTLADVICERFEYL